MARPCTVCTHEKRAEIDAALVAGESFRPLATRFAIGECAVKRHAKNHLVEPVAAAVEARRVEVVEQGENLVEALRDLRKQAAELCEAARNDADIRAALLAIARQEKLIELQARMLGEIEERVRVDIRMHPDFEIARGLLVETVRGCERCTERLVTGLRALGGGRGD